MRIECENARQQLDVADGAIVGSHFKFDGKTANMVDRERVARLMDIVRKIR